MATKELLSLIIQSSEKAANIARVVRRNEDLFKMLIEEKDEDTKNQRFDHDFKTLADIIIQESIKYDIGKVFPDLRNSIKGEEENEFDNVKIEICNDDEHETVEMLLKVLDGNHSAAEAFAKEIHREVSLELELPDIKESIDVNNIGIWIDPIDGTAEYINGQDDDPSSDYPNIQRSGLQCATVLIGAYDKLSGVPLLGVINQPFHCKIGDEYKSKVFWGISINNERHTNIIDGVAIEQKLAVISSSESMKEKLEEAGFACCAAAGAGYKILKVIENDVNCYFLSKPSTFKWDTCSGQAILKSLGGDIIDLNTSISNRTPIPLTYHDSEGKCNANGLIAYRRVDGLTDLLRSFY